MPKKYVCFEVHQFVSLFKRWVKPKVNKLSPCSWVLRDKLIESQLVGVIPRILWTLKILYHVHNSLPLVCGLSHTNPIHILPYDFSQMCFRLILPSVPRSSSSLFPWGFSTKSVCSSLLPHSFQLLSFDHPDIGKEYKLWSSLLCIFLHSPVTSSLLGPSIFLSSPFWNTHSLHFPHNMIA
jgi:hypothetical protein